MVEGNRLAVITGGGTGIGRAIALTLAMSGDDVVIAGRRGDVLQAAQLEIEARAPGSHVLPVACDVSDPDQVDYLVRTITVETGGTIDVLVNNAGGVASLGEGASTHEAKACCGDLLAANLVGVYLVIHALRPLLRRPGGRIVNISSIAAFRGGGDMYSAAKAGVVGLTYSLAAELGPERITVNAVAPGLVLGTEFFGERMTQERRNRTIAQIPAGRPGAPDDIATAVRYLSSPEASFVNGEVLHVNGGWLFGR